MFWRVLRAEGVVGSLRISRFKFALGARQYLTMHGVYVGSWGCLGLSLW